MSVIATGQVSIIDSNDSAPITAVITGNLPLQQLWFGESVTPDYSVTPLILTANIYVGKPSGVIDISEELTDRRWSTDLSTSLGSGNTLTIESNLAKSSPPVTHYFEGTYTDPVTGLSSKIVTQVTLSNVASGDNGAPGQTYTVQVFGQMSVEQSPTYLKNTAYVYADVRLEGVPLAPEQINGYRWLRLLEGSFEHICAGTPNINEDYGFATTEGHVTNRTANLGENISALGQFTDQLGMIVQEEAIQDLQVFLLEVELLSGQVLKQNFSIHDFSDPYEIQVISSLGDKLPNGEGNTQISPRVFYGGREVEDLTGWRFVWSLLDQNGIPTPFLDPNLYNESLPETRPYVDNIETLADGTFLLFADGIDNKATVVCEAYRPNRPNGEPVSTEYPFRILHVFQGDPTHSTFSLVPTELVNNFQNSGQLYDPWGEDRVDEAQKLSFHTFEGIPTNDNLWYPDDFTGEVYTGEVRWSSSFYKLGVLEFEDLETVISPESGEENTYSPRFPNESLPLSITVKAERLVEGNWEVVALEHISIEAYIRIYGYSDGVMLSLSDSNYYSIVTGEGTWTWDFTTNDERPPLHYSGSLVAESETDVNFIWDEDRGAIGTVTFLHNGITYLRNLAIPRYNYLAGDFYYYNLTATNQLGTPTPFPITDTLAENDLKVYPKMANIIPLPQGENFITLQAEPRDFEHTPLDSYHLAFEMYLYDQEDYQIPFVNEEINEVNFYPPATLVSHTSGDNASFYVPDYYATSPVSAGRLIKIVAPDGHSKFFETAEGDVPKHFKIGPPVDYPWLKPQTVLENEFVGGLIYFCDAVGHMTMEYPLELEIDPYVNMKYLVCHLYEQY